MKGMQSLYLTFMQLTEGHLIVLCTLYALNVLVTAQPLGEGCRGGGIHFFRRSPVYFLHIHITYPIFKLELYYLM